MKLARTRHQNVAFFMPSLKSSGVWVVLAMVFALAMVFHYSLMGAFWLWEFDRLNRTRSNNSERPPQIIRINLARFTEAIDRERRSSTHGSEVSTRKGRIK